MELFNSKTVSFWDPRFNYGGVKIRPVSDSLGERSQLAPALGANVPSQYYAGRGHRPLNL